MASNLTTPLLGVVDTAVIGRIPGATPVGAAVEQLATNYFDVRIWAAPAALINYAIRGWLIGLGRTTTALLPQLALNITNMALDAYFVLHVGLGVPSYAAHCAIKYSTRAERRPMAPPSTHAAAIN